MAVATPATLIEPLTADAMRKTASTVTSFAAPIRTIATGKTPSPDVTIAPAAAASRPG